MHLRLAIFSVWAIAAVLFMTDRPVIAQHSSQQTAPDNTKTNKRDRAKDQSTADQQKENSTDRQLSQKIRSALMQNKALSTDAHNVKIITQNGQVTLKGPVRTQEEK